MKFWYIWVQESQPYLKLRLYSEWYFLFLLGDNVYIRIFLSCYYYCS